MNLGTSLHGRLRNTSLPQSNGLLPLFEAVVNSIHSIEDANAIAQGKIEIEILRDGQGQLDFQGNSSKRGPDAKGDIKGFKITDNGIGFTKENMDSFLTLDSEYKADRGGRGVGRLLWLKAFQKAEVDSTWKDESGTTKTRTFTFDATQDITNESVNDSPESSIKTTVYLSGFLKKYRNAAPKTAETVAKNLLEHCLWYFVRDGGSPTITIRDDDEIINLDTVYEEHMVSSATTETVDVNDNSFELIHIKLSATSNRTHQLAFCANSRMVKTESLKGKIPGLFGNLNDKSGGQFVYECYVSSQIFDERVRSERTDFDIDEQSLGIFESQELSFREIRETVTQASAKFLSKYLDENKRQGRERVNVFVAQKAPKYRPIISRIPEEQLSVDPNITDKELDLFLHGQLAEIERKLVADGHEIMKPKANEGFADYNDRLQKYLKDAEDIKKSDLASYVSHRKVILDLFEKAIECQPDGTYSREDLIHNLIMPMGTESNEHMFENCNLWLFDERLAFHDYLASDKTISSMPITGSTKTKEPDLCALNVFDNPILVSEGTKLPLASIVVVEIKRPMRNDAKAGEDKDPIEQALGYLQRIRKGQVQTANGRPIPNSEDIPGFCYALCDITPSIKKRCDLAGLRATADGLGYFGYNPNYKAYIEVISFDRLVNAAKERNRAFFDKLGLPTT